MGKLAHSHQQCCNKAKSLSDEESQTSLKNSSKTCLFCGDPGSTFYPKKDFQRSLNAAFLPSPGLLVFSCNREYHNSVKHDFCIFGYFVSYCFCTKGLLCPVRKFENIKVRQIPGSTGISSPAKGTWDVNVSRQKQDNGDCVLAETSHIPTTATHHNTYHSVPTGRWRV